MSVPEKEPVTLLGTGPMAEQLGVEPNTLVAWVYRHPPGSPTPLPEPVRINTGRRFVYGWYEEKVDDLRRWKEDRDQGLPRSREELERIVREAEQDTSAEFEAAIARGGAEVVYPPGWKGGEVRAVPAGTGDEVIRTARRLATEWRDAKDRWRCRGSDKDEREESEAWDALDEFLVSNDLEGTELDPRGSLD